MVIRIIRLLQLQLLGRADVSSNRNRPRLEVTSAAKQPQALVEHHETLLLCSKHQKAARAMSTLQDSYRSTVYAEDPCAAQHSMLLPLQTAIAPAAAPAAADCLLCHTA